jgi:leucyl aminopeptidase
VNGEAEASVFVGTTAPLEAVAVDLLVVPVFQDEDREDDLALLDEATGGEVGRARSSGEFKGKVYTYFVTPVTAEGWAARRVALVGAGYRADSDAERVRRVAAAAGYEARRRFASTVGLFVRATFEIMTAAEKAADGLATAEFLPSTYKRNGDAPGEFPKRVEIVVPGGDAGALTEAVRHGRIVGEAANMARQLANEPGNVLTPREFSSRVSAEASRTGLAVEVLDETRIKELGMRLVLGVAQGSREPSRVLVLRHTPPGAPAAPVLGFVGKGVTFDTGGISIKPADGMDRMKYDMSGGAAVAGAMRALALLGAPRRAIGVIPMVENMPGGGAIRPGDVLTGANGKTVEITNTDAEGRLILADALWHAQQLGATHLVDVATLTGACMVALGRSVSGVMGNSPEWVETVSAAGRSAGDRLWALPIYLEAREQLRSEIADLINAAGRAGGAITAAAFLREFVGDLPWAHLDIAGTAWADTAEAHQPIGPTGVAVRTLTALAMRAGDPSPEPAG